MTTLLCWLDHQNNSVYWPFCWLDHQKTHYSDQTADWTIKTTHYSDQTADWTIKTTQGREQTADWTTKTTQYSDHTVEQTIKTIQCSDHTIGWTTKTTQCSDQTVEWTTENSGLHSPQKQRFPTSLPRPDRYSELPSTLSHEFQEFFPREPCSWVAKMSIYVHVVPTLRMCGDRPSHCIFLCSLVFTSIEWKYSIYHKNYIQ
jgi:hypothetical protein